MQLTYAESIAVAWALFWRGLVTMVLSAASGFVLGFIIGAILGIVGAPLTLIKIASGALSAAVGLAFWLPWHMRWALPRDFGRFRLELVRGAPEAGPDRPSDALTGADSPTTNLA